MRIILPLDALQIETAKPREREYKLADSGGLYLLINPNSAKYWLLKYRVLEIARGYQGYLGTETVVNNTLYAMIFLLRTRIKLNN
ncbi:hypothetical protein BJK05_09620 [Pectobacterium polaris]|nr:hypothetical protein BJK05_09620 [Pectobacterium polaris]